jgi:hypothetical protein
MEIREIIERLENVERFWDVILEAFKRHVEEKNDHS